MSCRPTSGTPNTWTRSCPRSCLTCSVEKALRGVYTHTHTHTHTHRYTHTHTHILYLSPILFHSVFPFPPCPLPVLLISLHRRHFFHFNAVIQHWWIRPAASLHQRSKIQTLCTTANWQTSLGGHPNKNNDHLLD